jgi:plastocyanin
MARRLVLPALVPLLTLLLAWAAAPLAVRAGDPCFHSTDRPPVSEAAATAVTIGDCSFFPTIAHIPVGATVTFTNTSPTGHEVAGANLTWGVAQESIAPGASVSETFGTAGVYPYSCMIHPGMTGAIVVGDVAALAGAGPAAGGAPAVDASPATDAAATGTTEPGAGTVEPLLVAAGLGLVALAVIVVAALVAGRSRREPAGG